MKAKRLSYFGLFAMQVYNNRSGLTVVCKEFSVPGRP